MSTNDVSFDVVLVSSQRSDCTSCSFPHDEWELLRAFHRDVELLRGTRFVQNGRDREGRDDGDQVSGTLP
jgi:hypothetical protein